MSGLEECTGGRQADKQTDKLIDTERKETTLYRYITGIHALISAELFLCHGAVSNSVMCHIKHTVFVFVKGNAQRPGAAVRTRQITERVARHGALDFNVLKVHFGSDAKVVAVVRPFLPVGAVGVDQEDFLLAVLCRAGHQHQRLEAKWTHHSAAVAPLCVQLQVFGVFPGLFHRVDVVVVECGVVGGRAAGGRDDVVVVVVDPVDKNWFVRVRQLAHCFCQHVCGEVGKALKPELFVVVVAAARFVVMLLIRHAAGLLLCVVVAGCYCDNAAIDRN